jgi:hypothetical protein
MSALSRVGWCVRRSFGHKYRPGETRCVNCDFERTWLEALTDSEIRDAEINRAEQEAYAQYSEGESYARGGRDE